MHLNTFSIVAYDADAQSWGVAVASKFLAAAAVVSWARAGAGAASIRAATCTFHVSTFSGAAGS